MLETFAPHSLLYTFAGVAALGGALPPRLIEHLPASPPMTFLPLGFAVFALPLGLGSVDPIEHAAATEYLTEIGVIVALMGAGLELDRPLGWRTWQPTVRLLAITMPLTIVLTALLGWWAVGLAPAAVEHAEFPNVERLWALVALTVVVSILVHGTSATLDTRRLDARREDERSAVTTPA